MVTAEKYTIAFCRLDCRRKRLKWVVMSYAKQVRSITGWDGFLFSLTRCNDKVYALINTAFANVWVIHIDIAVMGKGIVISLLPYSKVPCSYVRHTGTPFLIGCCSELFYIVLRNNPAGYVEKTTIGGVLVFKLGMINLRWEKMEDLKDAAFFLDFAHGYSAFYSPLGLGGYVHFLDESGKVIHSYDVKNKTIALSSMPHGEIKSQQEDDVGVDKENTESESRFPYIPFDVLTTIMEFCVGVEYLNFRATCKQCHLAAPMIQWSKGGGLQTYSVVSPWLMVLHKERGVISFTDPLFGDRYFINTPRELIGDVVITIYSSVCGWLLIRRSVGPLMFFNPFTNVIRELPPVPCLDTVCFSAPPTSSDCMVIGFTTTCGEWSVYVHFVGREQSWRRFQLNCSVDDSHSFHFATHYTGNLYALYYKGGLGFIDTDNQDYTWQKNPSCYESPKQNYLIKCDQRLLLVTMGEFGECVEVFKMDDSREWKKTESLGRHAIYICGKACLCIEAKMPEMANKIYFPRIHSNNRKIVFYSLETRRYHTLSMEESFGDFMGTEHHLDPHVWIEPSWS